MLRHKGGSAKNAPPPSIAAVLKKSPGVYICKTFYNFCGGMYHVFFMLHLPENVFHVSYTIRFLGFIPFTLIFKPVRVPTEVIENNL